MAQPPEYAPEYTRRERLRWLALMAMPAALSVLAARQWLFPSLEAFASNAACRTVAGLPGLTVLWYALFTGLPWSIALVLAATLGRRGIAILRTGQVPPLGEKVWRPTRVRRGACARLAGALHLGVVLAAIGLGVWGLGQAAAMDEVTHSAARGCTVDDDAGR